MTDLPAIHIGCFGFVFDQEAVAVVRNMAPPQFRLTFARQEADITDEMLADLDVLLVVSPVTDEMMAKAPRLRMIQKWGTGYDKIDLEAARRRGITVARTAGANASIIAEHTLALILATMRSLSHADASVRAGKWVPGELRMTSRRLQGKTVGIVGFGHIGKAVARLLRGFDVELLYTRPSGPDPDAEKLGAHFTGFADLLKRSDVVTLHCPGGAANARMINRDALALMKPGSYIVNTARGDLIVEDDLVDALKSGHLAGAGLDAFHPEPLPPGSILRELANTVLSPHSAGSVLDGILPLADHSFDNICRFLEGETIADDDLIVDCRHATADDGQAT